MSDETRSPADDAPDAAPDAAADAAADEATPTARTRPANPSAAAARRARQMGGTRRPQPGPRPAAAPDDADDAADDATTAAAAPTATTPATRAATDLTKPAPKSSVGKAAARPRPRPRPSPRPATTEEPAAEPEPTPAEPTRARRGLVAASLVLVVALLAVGTFFLVRTLTADPQISARETERALAAAKSDVALLTSYGYQTIDDDAAKAAAVITGDFKDQYLEAIDKVVKPQLPTTQTVAVGQVDTAGLVSASSSGQQVVVLVYAQQSVTNKAQTTPRIDALQIRVTMDLVGGQWLVSQLEQLGNNA